MNDTHSQRRNGRRARPRSARLEFVKRPRRYEGKYSFNRRWTALSRDYSVEEAKSKYGLPTIYRAMRLGADGWWIISAHRTKHAAMVACQRHARCETMASVEESNASDGRQHG